MVRLSGGAYIDELIDAFCVQVDGYHMPSSSAAGVWGMISILISQLVRMPLLLARIFLLRGFIANTCWAVVQSCPFLLRRHR